LNERRRQRLSGDLLAAVEEILAREVSDARLRAVHVTGVKLSRDGSHATLFYEVTETSVNRREDVRNAMESAKGFIRSRLASRMKLKSVPILSLVLDSSGEEGDRVIRLIRELMGD